VVSDTVVYDDQNELMTRQKAGEQDLQLQVTDNTHQGFDSSSTGALLNQLLEHNAMHTARNPA
jgi:hypothetical protein